MWDLKKYSKGTTNVQRHKARELINRTDLTYSGGSEEEGRLEGFLGY